MSTYPSAIGILPNPNSTDRLNNPSHSALHQNENAEIVALETFVGTLASVSGSLVYDIRSPNSNGGGHVQTADKGGTGYTSYIKGDLLVAQSTSVLTKLAVGIDGQILQANSSTLTGVTWGNGSSPKLAVSAASVFVNNSTAETSIMSIQLPASLLGTNNAVRATVFLTSTYMSTNAQLAKFRGIYGNTSIATINFASVIGGNATLISGTLELDIIANGAVNAQRGFLKTSLSNGSPTATVAQQSASFLGQAQTYSGLAAEDSGGAKPFGITVQWGVADVNNQVNVSGYVVERIS